LAANGINKFKNEDTPSANPKTLKIKKKQRDFLLLYLNIFDSIFTDLQEI